MCCESADVKNPKYGVLFGLLQSGGESPISHMLTFRVCRRLRLVRRIWHFFLGQYFSSAVQLLQSQMHLLQ